MGDDPAKNIRVKNLCLPYGCYDLEVTGDQLIETGWRMFDLTTGTETLSGGLGVSMKAATCVPTCESQSKIRTQLQYGATFDSDEDWESFILKITSLRTGDVVVQEAGTPLISKSSSKTIGGTKGRKGCGMMISMTTAIVTEWLSDRGLPGRVARISA